MAMEYLGLVWIHPFRTPTLLSEDVYAVIPSSEVSRSSIIPVDVHTRTSYPVATFSIQLDTHHDIEILNCTIDKAKWMHVESKPSPHTLVVSGILSDLDHAHDSGLLMTFNVRVKESAVKGHHLDVRLQVR